VNKELAMIPLLTHLGFRQTLPLSENISERFSPLAKNTLEGLNNTKSTIKGWGLKKNPRVEIPILHSFFTAGLTTV
jgi:hypothetical protein